MPICKTSKALRRPSKCSDTMRGADSPRWMSEQSVERYRATANECQTHARQARLAIDKEAWLKLAADWSALAEDAAQRRDDG